MCVGERIRKRRKELDVSAEELAKYVDVSRATIFRYEKGDIEKMPAVTLDLIAKKLRTSPAQLMGWANDSSEDYPKEDDKLKTIAAHIDDDVSEEEMQEIVDYIEYRKRRRKEQNDG